MQANSRVAVFFVKVSDGIDEKNTTDDLESADSRASPVIQRQLSSLGFLSSSPNFSEMDAGFDVVESSDDETVTPQRPAALTVCDLSEFCDGLEAPNFVARLTTFVKLVLETRLLSAINQLYDKHQQCLNVMIDSTFVAANDVACTPARLKYARDQEVRYCYWKVFLLSKGINYNEATILTAFIMTNYLTLLSPRVYCMEL